jgi:ABC-2 type transport system ATP-binding protein
MAASGSGPACRLQGLGKSFAAAGRTVHALREVEATVGRGQVTGLVGPDAAGKTTLMRLCVGLLLPDAGRVEVLGLAVAQSAQKVQSLVGYMPQRFGLYEDLSVRENLDLYADLRDLEPAERPGRYEALLQMTGLGPFTGRLAGALSGGMKQKLGLACALVKPTPMLVLDEPTVGVDPVSRRELWDMVYRVVEEEGVTVLLSTSYLDEAERCQEVILLHQGRVLGQGEPAGFSREMAGRSYLAAHPEGRRRQLQKRLGRLPGVLDAVIQGGGVRVVGRGQGPPELPADDELLSRAELSEVEPRFEDSFIARLRSQAGQEEEPEASGETGPQPQDRGGAAARPGDGPEIEVEGLTKRFGGFTAVDGVSFRVERGEVFGLLGANGAGKSTTFRMLCGLLPPSQGRLQVAGQDLRRAAARVRGRIGYMAQRFSLYTQLSVGDNLKFFASAYGLFGRRRRQRVAWALEEFGLRELAGAPSGELPLGYKQRLALAAALMHQPEILFLDEPTSGVDPLARREFWQRINLLAEEGVTVMVTTHFLEEAEYCDRLVIMEQGQILARGTPQEMKERFAGEDNPDPSLEDAFIALLMQKRGEQREAA